MDAKYYIKIYFLLDALMTSIILCCVLFELFKNLKSAGEGGVFALPFTVLVLIIYVPDAAALLYSIVQTCLFVKRGKIGRVIFAAILQILVCCVVCSPINFFDSAVSWFEELIGAQLVVSAVRPVVVLFCRLMGVIEK